jgi:serine protease
LRLADDDEVLDDASSMARGEGDAGDHRLTGSEGGAGQEHEVTITVTDYFEQTTTETKRVTLDV